MPGTARGDQFCSTVQPTIETIRRNVREIVPCAREDKQPDGFEAHGEVKRGLFHGCAASAQLFGFGVVRQSIDDPECLGKLRIQKRTHEFSCGRITPLHLKLPNLNESKHDCRNNCESTNHLRQICKRLQIHTSSPSFSGKFVNTRTRKEKMLVLRNQCTIATLRLSPSNEKEIGRGRVS